MSTNDKKDKNEELFDHIIEYGAGRWTDEISPDNIPEEELSDQLNQKIDNMFSSARKRANRKRRFITAQRIAAVFVMLLTMASIGKIKPVLIKTISTVLTLTTNSNLGD